MSGSSLFFGEGVHLDKRAFAQAIDPGAVFVLGEVALQVTLDLVVGLREGKSFFCGFGFLTDDEAPAVEIDELGELAGLERVDGLCDFGAERCLRVDVLPKASVFRVGVGGILLRQCGEVFAFFKAGEDFLATGGDGGRFLVARVGRSE